jgi:hypothetical protein
MTAPHFVTMPSITFVPLSTYLGYRTFHAKIPKIKKKHMVSITTARHECSAPDPYEKCSIGIEQNSVMKWNTASES